MFNPSRDEARRFFFDVRRKQREGLPLTPLEMIVRDVLAEHPEYDALLDDPDRQADRDFLPEAGETNPFLHIGLHLAVREQLSIDQPPGIAAHYQRLLRQTGSAHASEHMILECLAETLWQAQRNGTGPDAAVYLGCLERR